jgi:hypothetical protein
MSDNEPQPVRTQYQRMYGGASCQAMGFCTAEPTCESPAYCLDDLATAECNCPEDMLPMHQATCIVPRAIRAYTTGQYSKPIPPAVESVNHPAHYGGDTVYEVIKVLEAWGLDSDAYLFNVVKYIGRPGKGDYLEDLKKARWYLDRKIAKLEREK